MATAATANGDDHAAFRANALEIVGSWSVHDDDDGHLFYFNLETNESRWQAPDELRSLESEFMMKLMIQGAIARSGVWTVHDKGDGTLYYFNEKTRASVWECPEEWGVDPVQHGNGHHMQPPPPPPPPPSGAPAPQKKPEPAFVKAEERKPKKEKKAKRKTKHVAADEGESDAEPVPPTEEELEQLRQRAEEAKRTSENFRVMLRDKKIMPFCKWSVAFPQIVADPRFIAVPTMDERREIFEDFVKNRRDDIKSEKKQKLKDAKTRFAKLLREQLQRQRERGAFDEKLTLSVFLAMLEDNIPAHEYQSLQQDVFAFLPMTVQDKVWEKEMADFLEATKTERDQEAKLRAFLMEKLAGRGQYIAWHDAAVQDAIKAFETTCLSEAIQQAIVAQVAKALSAKPAGNANRERLTAYGEAARPAYHRERPQDPRDPTVRAEQLAPLADNQATRRGRPSRSRSTERRRDSRHGDDRKQETREESSHSHSHSRRRSRSHSRSGSRGRAHSRSRHGSRSARRHSRSRSRSSSSDSPSARERDRRRRHG